jgi:hypothetical protein
VLSSCRSPATKVVYQCPCGTGPTHRAPRHVRRRPGFIQKNQLRDIQRWLGCLPLTPRGLHVGALLLAGVQGVFTRELPFVELMSQRGCLDRNPVCRQACTPLRERQIPCFLQLSFSQARSVSSIPTTRDRRWPPIDSTATLSRLRESVPHLIDSNSADFKSVSNGRRTISTLQRAQHPVP